MNRLDTQAPWMQWLVANHRQVFFFLWAVIVGGFVLGMVSYYRRYTRRNFRMPGERSGGRAVPNDLRRLNPNERKPGEKAQ